MSDFFNNTYFPIFNSRNLVLGKSVKNLAGQGDPPFSSENCPANETVSSSFEQYFSNNDKIVLQFRTGDAICNDNLSGTVTLSVLAIEGGDAGLCGDVIFVDDDGNSRNILKIPNEGEPPTVSGETYNLSDSVTIKSENGSDCSFLVRIDFVGDVETLNSGYDYYEIGFCCECKDIPAIDEDGEEDWCSCESFEPECFEDADCPEGFVCIDGRCRREDEDDPDDPDEPGTPCESDDDCPDGFICVDGVCVKEEDDFVPSVGVPYYFANSIDVSFNKCGWGVSRYASQGVGDFLGASLDRSIFYRMLETIDPDEGCVNYDIGTGFYSLDSCIFSGRVCNYDNSNGIVEAFQTQNTLFASMRGTDAASNNKLDYARFSERYLSSQLSFQLQSASNTSFPVNNKQERRVTRTGSSITNLNSPPKEVIANYGNNGRYSKIRFYFATVIVESTAKSPNSIPSLDPVLFSINRTPDVITINQKDSLVGGRTSDQLVNYQGQTTDSFSIPYTKIAYVGTVRRNVRLSSGTIISKEFQQKILITEMGNFVPSNANGEIASISLSSGTQDGPNNLNDLILRDDPPVSNLGA